MTFVFIIIAILLAILLMKAFRADDAQTLHRYTYPPQPPGQHDNNAAPHAADDARHDASTQPLYESFHAADTAAATAPYSAVNPGPLGSDQPPAPGNLQPPYEHAAARSPIVFEPKPPALSGRVIALTIAAAAAVAAIILLIGNNSYGTWLVAGGGALGIFGLVITCAGVVGKRATWLTALTWLLLPIVTVAMLAGAIMPTSFITDDNVRIAATDNRRAEKTWFDISQHTIREPADIGELVPEQTQTFFASPTFNAQEDVPVVFHVRATQERAWEGMIRVHLSNLTQWHVRTATGEYVADPGIPYHDDLPSGLQKWVKSNNDDYYVRRDEELTLTSPAAHRKPADARHIHLSIAYGAVTVIGTAPDNDEYAWLHSQIPDMEPVTRAFDSDGNLLDDPADTPEQQTDTSDESINVPEGE